MTHRNRAKYRPFMLLAALATLGLPGLAHATTIAVNTTADPGASGSCALRDAITAANTKTATNGCPAGSGADTINFSVSGFITLTSFLPAVTGNLTIDGSGQKIVIDGASLYGVLVVGSLDTSTPVNTLNLNDVTIADGNAQWGGGIWVETTGTLVVTNSTFYHNTATEGGGAINIDGLGTIENCTFFENTETGSTFDNFLGGGAVRNSERTATTTPTTILNSTFEDNSAPSGDGGAIDNTEDHPFHVTNSILAGSPSGNNCSGTVTDGGYNISDDAFCGFSSTSAANGDTIGDSVADANIALDSSGLADNGGLTKTIALESGSYAIDAVPLASCPLATDQRGFPRPDESGETACDIGAYESGPSGSSALSVTIEIKPPATPPVPINLGAGGVIPVAILSTATFDATQVNPSTISLSGSTVDLRGNFRPQCSVKDVNGDGLPDLLCQVAVSGTSLTPSSTIATLSAETDGGQTIQGQEAIRIVP